MSNNEIQQTELRSELWSLIHQVSKLDMDIARKLDVVVSDLQEVQFRIGLDKGIEIANKQQGFLSIVNKESA